MLTRWRALPRPLRTALIGTTLVAFVLVATGLIALLSARPALAATSTLTVLGGSVSVREGAGDFAAAQDGQLVGPGMTVRTGPRSHAVLTYIDGSTVTIEPDSELAIEQLEVSAQGDLVAVASQAFGRTWHVVASKIGPTGRYEVRSPAATAAVRGTAFQFNVLRDGTLELETADGVVAASGGGGTVDVRAGQLTSVAPNARPAPPAPAPAPQAVVRITLDQTTNGVAVDQRGRSVGVQNGQALRYVPGSKVELVDGRLVLTIPTDEPGRISTVVRPDASSSQAPVRIRTEVLAGGSVVADTVEERRVDGSRTAKGGVVLTTAGVIVLPDSEARSFGAPIIGRTPDHPSADAPRPARLVTARADAAPAGTAGPLAAAAFLGGFQAFGPGTSSGTLVRFTAEIPKELLPPAPPSKDGCPPFAIECTRLRFVPDPSPSAAPVVDLTDTSFIPRDAVLAPGLSVFTRVEPAAAGAPGRPALAEGCDRTIFGLVCKDVPPSPGAAPGATLPPSGGAPVEQPRVGPAGPGVAPVERPRVSGSPVTPAAPVVPPRATCPDGTTAATVADCRPAVAPRTTPPAATPCPAGWLGTAPHCVAPRATPAPATPCPPGWSGVAPACIEPRPASPPSAPSPCPSGWSGTAPACVPPASPPSLPPAERCPEGLAGTPCVPVRGLSDIAALPAPSLTD